MPWGKLQAAIAVLYAYVVQTVLSSVVTARALQCISHSLDETVEFVRGGDGSVRPSRGRWHTMEPLHVLLEVRVTHHIVLLFQI